jgi:hypothetical protein
MPLTQDFLLQEKQREIQKAKENLGFSPKGDIEQDYLEAREINDTYEHQCICFDQRPLC